MGSDGTTITTTTTTTTIMAKHTPLKFVDHTYHDYSRYIEEGGQLCRHKKSGNNFPARLHKILSEPEYSHLITWMVSVDGMGFAEPVRQSSSSCPFLSDIARQNIEYHSSTAFIYASCCGWDTQPHGRAWMIIDRERFVQEVVPKYFSSSKYHSFCRQLNWWGFKRLYGPGPGK